MTDLSQSNTRWDSGGLAATFLLAGPLLARYAESYIDFARHEIRFEELLDSKPWSSGESILIRAAWDLFNGGGKCTLDELVSTLDEQNLDRVLHAIAIRRRRRSPPRDEIGAAFDEAG